MSLPAVLFICYSPWWPLVACWLVNDDDDETMYDALFAAATGQCLSLSLSIHNVKLTSDTILQYGHSVEVDRRMWWPEEEQPDQVVLLLLLTLTRTSCLLWWNELRRRWRQMGFLDPTPECASLCLFLLALASDGRGWQWWINIVVALQPWYLFLFAAIPSDHSRAQSVGGLNRSEWLIEAWTRSVPVLLVIAFLARFFFAALESDQEGCGQITLWEMIWTVCGHHYYAELHWNDTRTRTRRRHLQSTHAVQGGCSWCCRSLHITQIKNTELLGEQEIPFTHHERPSRLLRFFWSYSFCYLLLDRHFCDDVHQKCTHKSSFII